MKGVHLDPPKKADPGDRFASRLQTGVGLAISLVGLAAYLYLVGGLVWWLRLTAARLPADEAIAVVGNRRLFATGLKAMLFEVAVLAVLMLMVWLAWRITWRRRRGEDDAREYKVREPNPAALALVLFGLGCGATILVAFLQYLSPWWPSQIWSTVGGAVIGGMGGAVGAAFVEKKFNAKLRSWLEAPWVRIPVFLLLAAIAVVFLSAPAGMFMLVVIGLAQFGDRLNQLRRVRHPLRLFPAVLILGGAFALIAASYQATPPVSFARAVVALKGERELIAGYIGETSGGFLLARCQADEEEPSMGSKPALELVPADEVDAFYLGGARYVFDHGKDPSLLDLARYFYNRDGLREFLPTVAVDPRQNKLACGRRQILRFAGSRIKVLLPAEKGVGVLIAHAAGVIEVTGRGLQTVLIQTEKAGKVPMLVLPDDPTLAELQKAGEARVEINAHYESDGGYSEEQTRVIRLVSVPKPRQPNAR